MTFFSAGSRHRCARRLVPVAGVLLLATLPATRTAAQRQRAEPRRDVDDPGVVATGQRVTPAGLQSVFEGRVGGVRFGLASGDLWVAVPGGIYRMDWQGNRVLAHAPFNGRPGVQGVVVDRAGGRVLVSSVGRLPGMTGESRMPGTSLPAARDAIAQLTALDGATTGDPADAGLPDRRAG